MTFEALDWDKAKQTKVYAVRISKAEIESVKWTKEDQKFFERCSKGPVSRQLLGISLLAKRIEEEGEQMHFERLKPVWKPTKPTADPATSGPGESGQN